MDIIMEGKKIHTLLDADEKTLGIDNYTYTLSESIVTLKNEWNEIATSSKNLYFSYDYLRALEEVPPSGLCYLYMLIKEEGAPVGIYYFQYKRISLKESLSLKNEHGCSVQGVKEGFKMGIAQLLDFNVLVCGNVSLTGNNGSHVLKSIDHEMKGKLLDRASTIAIEYLKNAGVKVSAVLLKDYHTDSCPVLSGRYTKFNVQPNMVVKNVDRWSSLDAYLSDLKSKYRVRYKKARKSLKNIEVRELTLDDLYRYREDMHNLYAKIANSASFNLFVLPDDYFYNLKKHLGDDFHVKGYFDGDKMHAFYTYVVHGEEVDAHFLGYDNMINKSHKLYLNILYDMMEITIQRSKKRLILSRTAMEIKSTVGAEGVEMNLFFKVLNPLMNGFFRTAFDFFNPTQDYILRSPFKEG